MRAVQVSLGSEKEDSAQLRAGVESAQAQARALELQLAQQAGESASLKAVVAEAQTQKIVLDRALADVAAFLERVRDEYRVRFCLVHLHSPP